MKDTTRHSKVSNEISSESNGVQDDNHMENTQEFIAQLDALFHPKSVAVVGVPRGMKTGKLFLISLLDLGFPGDIYPVNPQAQEIDGLKAYPSVSAIPGSVDLAIVLVPNHSALSVVKECAAKGVKGAVLFTAGYKETGTDEGMELENELVRVARSSGMRILGPNCMGFYVPKTGLSFLPELSKEPGPVGIISHSGSVANILCRMGPQKGIRFSKAVSLGNECDLSFAHFLTYLGTDPETHVIGGYLENIKDGTFFLNALRKASLEKPVILWKQGLNPEGCQAAFSHTGALTGSKEIWEAVVRQGGAVPVVGFEPWVDALMGFSLLPHDLGDRVTIISGPGGLAVSAAEACGNVGVRLAELSAQTRAKLAEFVSPTGTSLKNPVDVGMTAALNIEIYIQAAQTVAADPGVDGVVVMGSGLNPEANRIYTKSLIKIRQNCGKPFLMVSIPGFDPELAQDFCQAGVPCFDSAERALGTYSLVRRYQLWRKARVH